MFTTWVSHAYLMGEMLCMNKSKANCDGIVYSGYYTWHWFPAHVSLLGITCTPHGYHMHSTGVHCCLWVKARQTVMASRGWHSVSMHLASDFTTNLMPKKVCLPFWLENWGGGNSQSFLLLSKIQYLIQKNEYSCSFLYSKCSFRVCIYGYQFKIHFRRLARFDKFSLTFILKEKANNDFQYLWVG